MDWICGIQQGIDYIEAHLTEKLDYQDIARQAYSSVFQFQRVFHILCGYTLGEYIRARRLTLAGNELSFQGTKVIDTALKYGYDSPEELCPRLYPFPRNHAVPGKRRRCTAEKFFPPLGQTDFEGWKYDGLQN
ncbi:MAG: helix-turn-helix domain-containing protein [Oscillospiraceae bacterium]